jgi:hypothetical protein
MSLPKEPAYSVDCELSVHALAMVALSIDTEIRSCWIVLAKLPTPRQPERISSDGNIYVNAALLMLVIATVSNVLGGGSGSRQSRICSLPQSRTYENLQNITPQLIRGSLASARYCSAGSVTFS